METLRKNPWKLAEEPFLIKIAHFNWKRNDTSRTQAGREKIPELNNIPEEILDPSEINVECRKDQAYIVSMFGENNSISSDVLWTTSETPVPEEYLK